MIINLLENIVDLNLLENNNVDIIVNTTPEVILNINQGLPGKNGIGIPIGGTTNQVLTKIDNSDFNTTWTDIVTDATFIYTQLQSSSEWLIIHSLNKKTPSVTIVDTGGNVVIGEIEYSSLNIIKLKFSAPFSGTAYLN